MKVNVFALMVILMMEMKLVQIVIFLGTKILIYFYNNLIILV